MEQPVGNYNAEIPAPDMGEPPKKKSNTTLIIIIVVVVVLCCCCAVIGGGYAAFTSGMFDELMNSFSALAFAG
jgi:flagellar basal body-associated protein FliL